MGLHYGLLRYDEEHVDDAYRSFLPFVVEINDALMLQANRFKAMRKDLSYTDYIGYLLAAPVAFPSSPATASSKAGRVWPLWRENFYSEK